MLVSHCGGGSPQPSYILVLAENTTPQHCGSVMVDGRIGGGALLLSLAEFVQVRQVLSIIAIRRHCALAPSFVEAEAKTAAVRLP